jgi:hypothetical protein
MWSFYGSVSVHKFEDKLKRLKTTISSTHELTLLSKIAWENEVFPTLKQTHQIIFYKGELY